MGVRGRAWACWVYRRWCRRFTACYNATLPNFERIPVSFRAVIVRKNAAIWENAGVCRCVPYTLGPMCTRASSRAAACCRHAPHAPTPATTPRRAHPCPGNLPKTRPCQRCGHARLYAPSAATNVYAHTCAPKPTVSKNTVGTRVLFVAVRRVALGLRCRSNKTCVEAEIYMWVTMVRAL